MERKLKLLLEQQFENRDFYFYIDLWMMLWMMLFAHDHSTSCDMYDMCRWHCLYFNPFNANRNESMEQIRHGS